MFAVIKTGGKQYKVAQDQIIVVEKLAGDAGDVVEFDDILAIEDGETRTIGAPRVDGAGVRGTVVEQARDDKVIVFKRKRRQNYRRTKGHRQHLTSVRITEIITQGFKKGAAKAAARKDEAAADAPAPTQDSAGSKPAVKKPAAKKAAAKTPAAKKAAAGKPAAKSKPAPKGTE